MSDVFTRNERENNINIPWYYRQDGTCDCIPPYSCCNLCCKNYNTASCIMECSGKYDKWINPISPKFKPIEGLNYKTVKVIKLNILEKAIVYFRDILPEGKEKIKGSQEG